MIPVGQEEAKTALSKLKPTDDKQLAVAGASTVPPTQENPPADNTQAEPPPPQPATITVKSTPPGADITVDGKFMGNTPSTIQLTPGDHAVSVEKEGLRPWQREMTISAGGNITIDATLDKP